MHKIFVTLAALTLSLSVCFADSDITAEKAAQNTPDGWTAVALPNIPTITTDNTYDITNYGASTTSTDNASAIQAAINAAAVSGGMVVIPAGEWLSGPITMKSKIVFHIAANATLKLLPYAGHGNTPTADQYPGTTSYTNFISTGGSSITDVIIEGESQETSIIDGQGAPWWKAVEDYGSFTRPCLIRLQKGSRFLFRNMRLQNSPGTNLTLGQSGNANNMTVHNVTISNPASTLGTGKASHNTDGIPMWGPYINIYDCNISTGDDNIVADSNTQYCHAWNLTFGSGHGASFGSYTEKVHDIIYENITFNNTETGFRIKTARGRSGNDYEGTNSNGSVKNIILRNSTMTGVLQPIMLTTMYDADKEDPSTVESADITYQTPEYSNILFQNITSTGTEYNKSFKYGNAIYIYGLPESYIHDITFDNVQVSAQKGIFAAYCKDINFINGSTVTNTRDGVLYSKNYKATISGLDKKDEGGETRNVTLSSSTYKESSTDGYTWNFNDGYSISNSSEKAYSASSTSPYVKYSAVQFTINLPSGVIAKAIQFDGFDNYDTGDSYIKDVNGIGYESTSYVFPATKAVTSHKITLSSPATTSLPFTIGGKQTCLTLTLTVSDATGIQEVLSEHSSFSNKCYNILGQQTNADSKGIVIKNGRKYINK